MATPEQKRRAMDSVAHRETRAHLRAFRGKASVAPVAVASPVPPLKLAKRVVMDAVSNVQTVAQVGAVKLAGGVAVYVARIREVDRENQKSAPARPYSRPHLDRRNDFLRD